MVRTPKAVDPLKTEITIKDGFEGEPITGTITFNDADGTPTLFEPSDVSVVVNDTPVTDLTQSDTPGEMTFTLTPNKTGTNTIKVEHKNEAAGTTDFNVAPAVASMVVYAPKYGLMGEHLSFFILFFDKDDRLTKPKPFTLRDNWTPENSSLRPSTSTSSAYDNGIVYAGWKSKIDDNAYSMGYKLTYNKLSYEDTVTVVKPQNVTFKARWDGFFRVGFTNNFEIYGTYRDTKLNQDVEVDIGKGSFKETALTIENDGEFTIFDATWLHGNVGFNFGYGTAATIKLKAALDTTKGEGFDAEILAPLDDAVNGTNANFRVQSSFTSQFGVFNTIGAAYYTPPETQKGGEDKLLIKTGDYGILGLNFQLGWAYAPDFLIRARYKTFVANRKPASSQFIGEITTTIPSSGTLSSLKEDFVTIGVKTVGNVLPGEKGEHLTINFVIQEEEKDGLDSKKYEPAVTLPNDPRKNGTQVYEATLTNEVWAIKRFVADGKTLTASSNTGAKIAIWDDNIVLTVPKSEITGTKLGVRVSLFKHQGGGLKDTLENLRLDFVPSFSTFYRVNF